MAAPTLAATYVVPATGATSGTTALVSASFTPPAGEVIIVKATCNSGTMTITGGGLTWRTLIFSAPASNAVIYVWGVVVGTSPGAITVTVTPSASSPHAMVVERWSGANLATTPAVSTPLTGSGAPLATVTTTAADSIVSWVDADWNESAVTTSTYRSGAIEENKFLATGAYSAWFARQAAPTAGSQTIGMTAPAGQTWNMGGVEILAAATSTLTNIRVGAATPSAMYVGSSLVSAVYVGTTKIWG